MGDTLRTSKPRPDPAQVLQQKESPQKLAAQPRKFDLLASPPKKEPPFPPEPSRRTLAAFLFNPGRQDLICLLLNSYPAPPSQLLGARYYENGTGAGANVAANNLAANNMTNNMAANGAGAASNDAHAPGPGARFRGDLIFLPPPGDPASGVADSSAHSALDAAATLRNNSIFSSLIQIPNSASASAANSVSGAPRSQKRRRSTSVSLGDNDKDAAAAFWELLNMGGGLIAGLSNDSVNAFLASLQNNGSIDFTGMSDQQRRDSLLKFINDQGVGPGQGSQLQSAGQVAGQSIAQKQREPQNQAPTQPESTRLREDIFDRLRTRKPSGGDHLSPASSMSSRSSHKVADELHLPKASPAQLSTQPYFPALVPPQAMQKQPAAFYQQYPGDPYPFSSGTSYPPQKQRNQYLFGEAPLYQTGLPGLLSQPALFFRPPLDGRMNYSYRPQPDQLGQSLPLDHTNQPPLNLPGTPLGNQMGTQINGQMGNPMGPRMRMGSQMGNQIGNQMPSQMGNPMNGPLNGQIHGQMSPNQLTHMGQLGQLSPEKGMVPAQQHAQAEDGRPLLGATKVDQLMLVIQSREKGNKQAIPQAADGSVMAAEDDKNVLPLTINLVGGVEKPARETAGTELASSDKKHKRRAKTQQCPYCLKQFNQSTHLDVHVRSHIGYKPFQCTYCLKRFTQGGNLRTHIRLHTGEKPFTCEECNRLFSRKGNLAAHILTHKKEKPFECRLDGCDKSFTQLGNLKSHQNKFHLRTLNRLTQTLAELSGPDLENLDPEQKELLDYFRKLYKNSNRGIRGRGKRLAPAGEGSSTQSSPQQVQTQLLGQPNPTAQYPDGLRRDY